MKKQTNNFRGFYTLTSAESVGIGHPDKICDQIADYILDECLKQDPHSKVACEVIASNRLILIGGEITTTGYVDLVQAAWHVLFDLGYNENDFTIISNVNKQSNDIVQSVIKQPKKTNKIKLGAGDQGIVYGFACNDTKEYLPLSYVIARSLIQKAIYLIDQKKLKWAKHDMKSLVVINWNNIEPKLEKIIFSIQHDQKVLNSTIQKDVQKLILDPIVKKYQLNSNYQSLINTSKRFIIGGPIADTGLTNRKLMVDSYGSQAFHGGGGFSGKDGSKTDRTGAYLARWIAKNLVATQLCNWCEVQIVYVLGYEQPISLDIRTSEKISINRLKIIDAIKQTFPLNLSEVIKILKLDTPIFYKLSKFGHFGHDNKVYPWESLNKVEQLKKILKIK